jgi:hypothetical protein
MTKSERQARKLLRDGAPLDAVLPAMEEADRENGLTGVWKRALGALRGGREVRSKEREPKEGPS